MPRQTSLSATPVFGTTPVGQATDPLADVVSAVSMENSTRATPTSRDANRGSLSGLPPRSILKRDAGGGSMLMGTAAGSLEDAPDPDDAQALSMNSRQNTAGVLGGTMNRAGSRNVSYVGGKPQRVVEAPDRDFEDEEPHVKGGRHANNNKSGRPQLTEDRKQEALRRQMRQSTLTSLAPSKHARYYYEDYQLDENEEAVSDMLACSDATDVDDDEDHDEDDEDADDGLYFGVHDDDDDLGETTALGEMDVEMEYFQKIQRQRAAAALLEKNGSSGGGGGGTGLTMAAVPRLPDLEGAASPTHSSMGGRRLSGGIEPAHPPEDDALITAREPTSVMLQHFRAVLSKDDTCAVNVDSNTASTTELLRTTQPFDGNQAGAGAGTHTMNAGAASPRTARGKRSQVLSPHIPNLSFGSRQHTAPDEDDEAAAAAAMLDASAILQGSLKTVQRKRKGANITARTVADRKDHIWLVQHDIGAFAHIKMFKTPEEFARHAISVVGLTEEDAAATAAASAGGGMKTSRAGGVGGMKTSRGAPMRTARMMAAQTAFGSFTGANRPGGNGSLSENQAMPNQNDSVFEAPTRENLRELRRKTPVGANAPPFPAVTRHEDPVLKAALAVAAQQLPSPANPHDADHQRRFSAGGGGGANGGARPRSTSQSQPALTSIAGGGSGAVDNLEMSFDLTPDDHNFQAKIMGRHSSSHHKPVSPQGKGKDKEKDSGRRPSQAGMTATNSTSALRATDTRKNKEVVPSPSSAAVPPALSDVSGSAATACDTVADEKDLLSMQSGSKHRHHHRHHHHAGSHQGHGHHSAEAVGMGSAAGSAPVMTQAGPQGAGGLQDTQRFGGTAAMGATARRRVGLGDTQRPAKKMLLLRGRGLHRSSSSSSSSSSRSRSSDTRSRSAGSRSRSRSSSSSSSSSSRSRSSRRKRNRKGRGGHKRRHRKSRRSRGRRHHKSDESSVSLSIQSSHTRSRGTYDDNGSYKKKRRQHRRRSSRSSSSRSRSYERRGTASHSTSSSSSSSATTASEEIVEKCFWLDVQSGNIAVIQNILRLYGLDERTTRCLLRNESVDTLEAVPNSNYVFANIVCKSVPAPTGQAVPMARGGGSFGGSNIQQQPPAVTHTFKVLPPTTARRTAEDPADSAATGAIKMTARGPQRRFRGGGAGAGAGAAGGDAGGGEDPNGSITNSPETSKKPLIPSLKSGMSQMSPPAPAIGENNEDPAPYGNMPNTPTEGGPEARRGARPSQPGHGLLPATDYVEGKGEVVVSVIVFEDWIITIHAQPFGGMFELLRRIQNTFSLRKKHKSLSGGKGRDYSDRSSIRALAAPGESLMTTAWVLSTMVDYVVESFLPDPTVLLTEVDRVDEMVLLFASVQSDQQDLLRSIAILRKRISTLRACMFQKEKFIQQFISPVIRTTFISRTTRIADQYRHTLSQISHVSQRLDAARDVLSQANSNFVSGVSMQMAAASNQMNLKMQLLSQVASVCLPLNIITGLMGMNVRVPFQATEGDSDIPAAFLVICGIMVLWILVTMPSMVSMMRNIYSAGEKDRRNSVEDLGLYDDVDNNTDSD